jgi:2-octaprenyl-6-methoxyphenol hydroxylase
MKQTTNDYDVVIVGGGLVGASLACALGSLPEAEQHRIAVVEAFAYESGQQPSFDDRTVALAYGSRQIFAALDLWSRIEALGVEPIHHIHISDRGHAGITHLDCAGLKQDALGYVATSRVLGQALSSRLNELSNLTLLCPATVTHAEFGHASATLTIDHQGQQQVIRAGLVIAADGGESLIRQQAGVKILQHQYDQSALITNVLVDRPHAQTAYERFTARGPMALLPTINPEGVSHGQRYALVWTERPEQVARLLDLPDEIFLAELQQCFGPRPGHFVQVGQRLNYPLKMLHAREHVRSRLAFIGNAAHTLHPVAGQGFNLGLRDVAVLAQVIVDGWRAQRDIGSLSVLREYAQWRRRDHLQTMVATDSLVRLFSSSFPPLQLARNLGLLALDMMPSLKKVVTRQAMGFVGHLPRLARGLPL